MRTGRPAKIWNTQTFEKDIERITESGCWVWMRRVTRDGYGRESVKNKNTLMHRLSWELHKGPIPDGKQVLHNCDVPGCCNPAHLFLGTIQENMNDRDRKGRSAKKLSAEQILAIKTDPRSGASLGRLHGVSASLISMIKTGKIWKHI